MAHVRDTAVACSQLAMAEAAVGIGGLVVGGVALAALFSTCLDCFEFVVAAREFGSNYELLCTQLGLERLRFLLWGQSVGFGGKVPSSGTATYDERLDNPEIYRPVQRALNAVHYLLSQTETLTEKYGMKAIEPNARVFTASQGFNIFEGTFDRFMARIRDNQREKSVVRESKWAISDASKFEVMISRLRDLIDALESITQSLGLKSQQHKMLQEEIDKVTDVGSLILLREATADSETEISDAANRRLETLETESTEALPQSQLQGATYRRDISIIHNTRVMQKSSASQTTQNPTPNLGRGLGVYPQVTKSPSMHDFLRSSTAIVWSSRGQFVEYDANENIPLTHKRNIGSSPSGAIVDKVECTEEQVKGWIFARKTITCIKRLSKERVEHEVQIMKALRHPHIVALVGYYTQGPEFGILMYPAAVCDLGAYMDYISEDEDRPSNIHPMTPSEKENRLTILQTYFICLSQALAFLHNLGIRHKDIKPKNILVDEHESVLLSNFGISRKITDEGDSDTSGPTARTYRYSALK